MRTTSIRCSKVHFHTRFRRKHNQAEVLCYTKFASSWSSGCIPSSDVMCLHTHTHTQEPAVLPFGSLISFFPRVIASALRRPRVPISSSDPPSPPPEIFFTVSILLAIHSKTSRNKPPDADNDHEETLQNLLMHTTTRLHDSAQIARSKCKSCAKIANDAWLPTNC